MNRFIVVITIAALLFAPHLVNAQDSTVWKGLVFDQSVIEDAVNAAGKPKSRRIEKMKTLEKDGSLSKTEEMQIVEFEKIDEWKKVSLGFYKGKLFKAKFWPKNKTMPGSDLPNKYTANFVAVEGFAKGIPLSVFEGQKEPEVPRVYPVIYFMVSSIPERHILATINNNSWKAVWKDTVNKATVSMFPGFVETIEIISRHNELK